MCTVGERLSTFSLCGVRIVSHHDVLRGGSERVCGGCVGVLSSKLSEFLRCFVKKNDASRA